MNRDPRTSRRQLWTAIALFVVTTAWTLSFVFYFDVPLWQAALMAGSATIVGFYVQQLMARRAAPTIHGCAHVSVRTAAIGDERRVAALSEHFGRARVGVQTVLDGTAGHVLVAEAAGVLVGFSASRVGDKREALREPAVAFPGASLYGVPWDRPFHLVYDACVSDLGCGCCAEALVAAELTAWSNGPLRDAPLLWVLADDAYGDDHRLRARLEYAGFTLLTAFATLLRNGRQESLYGRFPSPNALAQTAA